ncbi:MAG: FKBP-type peptidyl-prolyl cis-trans isomerase, partial [bacterium]|nr:FKBP-type peptidyl-prolyl cis-trans isomerase [bacterium]
SATTLRSVDLVKGKGRKARAGDTLTLNYCGVGLKSTTVVDSSWTRGGPLTFPLSQLIAGWRKGIPGMKVGGTRLLVIPGRLAYGSNPPQGGSIKPNETLAFVITLNAIA